MQVSQLIESRASSEIVSCDPATSLHDAVRMLANKRIGAMPVIDAGQVVGIVSERDVLYCLAAEGSTSLAKPVREVMTSPVIKVERTIACDDALALMTRHRFRHLPVVEGGTMCGFLSIGDLVKSRLDEVSQEAAAMRDYIRLA